MRLNKLLVGSILRARCHLMSFNRKASGKISHSQYCFEYVKKYDYENYLATLLLPNAARTAVFAIKAFNTEIAQVQDVVSEKNIGLMRFQFWKDSIDRIYNGHPPQSPIALELARAVDKHSLTKRWLLRLIDAREQRLERRTPSSLEDCEEYGENTAASVNYLCLESLGVKNVHADHAASHLGRAQGLVTLLRAVPYSAQTHAVNLPIDLMIQHNVSQEDIVRGSTEQKVKDLIFDIASQANHHLETARTFKKDCPKDAIPAFLGSVPVQTYLRALQYADFGVFHEQLQRRNSWLPLLYLKQKWTRTY